MAEPALAAVQTATGGFDCYRAQWGGADEHVAAVFAAEPAERLLDLTWEFEGTAEPPLADAVDYLRDAAVYLLTPTDWVVYLPVWAGLPPNFEPAPDAGLLVRVHSVADSRSLRGTVRREKGLLTDRLAAERGTVAEAIAELWGRLATRELYGSTALAEISGADHRGQQR